MGNPAPYLAEENLLSESDDIEEGEPSDLGDDEGVPPELVELYEVIEWQDAVGDAGSSS